MNKTVFFYNEKAAYFVSLIKSVINAHVYCFLKRFCMLYNNFLFDDRIKYPNILQTSRRRPTIKSRQRLRKILQYKYTFFLFFAHISLDI